jgi:hypothetical protein
LLGAGIRYSLAAARIGGLCGRTGPHSARRTAF